MLSALSKFAFQPSYLWVQCRTYPVDLVIFDAPYACDSAEYCREYCMKVVGELDGIELQPSYLEEQCHTYPVNLIRCAEQIFSFHLSQGLPHHLENAHVSFCSLSDHSSSIFRCYESLGNCPAGLRLLAGYALAGLC